MSCHKPVLLLTLPALVSETGVTPLVGTAPDCRSDISVLLTMPHCSSLQKWTVSYCPLQHIGIITICIQHCDPPSTKHAKRHGFFFQVSKAFVYLPFIFKQRLGNHPPPNFTDVLLVTVSALYTIMEYTAQSKCTKCESTAHMSYVHTMTNTSDML